MEQQQKYFARAASARLTGEQARILFCLLSAEHDGDIWIKRADIAKRVGIAESNISRSLKALKENGLINVANANGYDGKPELQINRSFDLKVEQVPALASDQPEDERLLYEATSLFLRELYMIHASHLVYRIVGLNAKKFRGAGAEFVNFSQMLAQRSIVIGLESLFERKDDGAGLCSVRGLMQLAKGLELKNKNAVLEFVTKYDVAASDDWYADVNKVLAKQSSTIGDAVKLTSALRNSRIAHLSQPLKPRQYMLPSIAKTEEIIEFAHDFYSLITVGFLNSIHPAELRTSIGDSLVMLLKERFGVSEARFDFEEEH